MEEFEIKEEIACIQEAILPPTTVDGEEDGVTIKTEITQIYGKLLI